MKRFFLFLVLLVGAFQIRLAAQNLPVNIDNLSDQQIILLMSQYQLVGLSEAELEMKAREKGLSSDQIAQLKRRMSLVDPATMKELNGSIKNASDPDEKRMPLKTYNNQIGYSPFDKDTSGVLKPFWLGNFLQSISQLRAQFTNSYPTQLFNWRKRPIGD
jgi:hypothetical protein